MLKKNQYFKNSAIKSQRNVSMAVYFCPKHYSHPFICRYWVCSIKENMRPLVQGSTYRKHSWRFAGTVQTKLCNLIHY